MQIYFEDLKQDIQRNLLKSGINEQKIQNGDPIGEMFEDMFKEEEK